MKIFCSLVVLGLTGVVKAEPYCPNTAPNDGDPCFNEPEDVCRYNPTSCAEESTILFTTNCFCGVEPQLLTKPTGGKVCEVCSLPSDVGPCDGAFTRYYYNSDSKTCERFSYGGCAGNANNFETFEICQSICEPTCEEICSLASDSGPCEALIPRYFFNAETQACEQFNWGGCDGNANNFETLEACEGSCPCQQGCCGQDDSPYCLIGNAACCPDGTWACPNGDTDEYPCPEGTLISPQGPLCEEESSCCGESDFPLCFVGTAACCPDGRWACPNGDTQEYPCSEGTLISPQGPLCVQKNNTDACCDPLKEPGKNGNPICFEGHACCPNGEWSCSIGDGRTFPCQVDGAKPTFYCDSIFPEPCVPKQCPTAIPFGQQCTEEGLKCNYQPHGCPESSAPGVFLTFCECSSGQFICAQADPLPCNTVARNFCFSGASIVEVEHTGPVRMKDLQIGDRVHVGEGVFEPIYSFGHYGPNRQGEFLDISTTEDRTNLQISAEHMVYVKSKGYVPASSLVKGDVLITGSNDEACVAQIRNIQATGVYAPFTPSGKIVVNNVLSSSFVAFEGKASLRIAGINVSYQWLDHTFEFPHRVLCHYLGQCLKEEYNADGVSRWAETSFKIVEWMMEQNFVLRHTLLILMFLVLHFFTFLESFMMVPIAWALLCSAAVILIGSDRVNRNIKMREL